MQRVALPPDPVQFACHIAGKEWLSPAESAKDPERGAISRRIKAIGSASDALVVKCRNAWLAYKLAIPVQALENSINPGFAEFAKRVHLARYLATFGHTLQVHDNYKISLLFQNVLRPWEEISKEVQQDIVNSPEFPKLYNPLWVYSKEGVQAKTYYEWTELKPFKKEDPQLWNSEYRFEICTLCTGKFRPLGDHTWMRLKTPQGEVYSFGVYREDNEFRSACAAKRGVLQSPDISEFWDEPIHTLSFTITQAQFEKAKATVEQDRKKPIHFHILHSNCAAYATNLAKQIGIEVSANMSFVRNLIPERLRRAGLYWMKYTPQPIQRMVGLGGKVLHHICAIPFNLLSWKLGQKAAWRNPCSIKNITYAAPYRMAFEPTLPRGIRCVRSTTWGGAPLEKCHGASN